MKTRTATAYGSVARALRAAQKLANRTGKRVQVLVRNPRELGPAAHEAWHARSSARTSGLLKAYGRRKRRGEAIFGVSQGFGSPKATALWRAYMRSLMRHPRTAAGKLTYTPRRNPTSAQRARKRGQKLRALQTQALAVGRRLGYTSGQKLLVMGPHGTTLAPIEAVSVKQLRDFLRPGRLRRNPSFEGTFEGHTTSGKPRRRGRTRPTATARPAIFKGGKRVPNPRRKPYTVPGIYEPFARLADAMAAARGAAEWTERPAQVKRGARIVATIPASKRARNPRRKPFVRPLRDSLDAFERSGYGFDFTRLQEAATKAGTSLYGVNLTDPLARHNIAAQIRRAGVVKNPRGELAEARLRAAGNKGAWRRFMAKHEAAGRAAARRQRGGKPPRHDDWQKRLEATLAKIRTVTKV